MIVILYLYVQAGLSYGPRQLTHDLGFREVTPSARHGGWPMLTCQLSKPNPISIAHFYTPSMELIEF